MGALRARLEQLGGEGGMAAWFARHAALRAHVDGWAERAGARIVAAAGRRAPTHTLVAPPAGRSAGAVLHELRLRGFVLGTPLDASDDAAIAFGHMGDVEPADLDPMLEALAASLAG
jgi:aspartate aminotransferase-like enzyme